MSEPIERPRVNVPCHQHAWNCLHNFIAVLDEPDISQDDLLERVTALLRNMWPDMDATRVRLCYAGRYYGAEDLPPATCVIEEPILSRGKPVGAIDIGFGSPEARHAWQTEATGVLPTLARFLGTVLEWKRTVTESRLEEQHLLQSDKMAALGTLISGVAHEINNPAHIAMLSAQNLSEAWKTLGPMLDQHQDTLGDFRIGQLSYAELQELVPDQISGIVDSLHRIESIVTELRDYVKQYPVQRAESVDINLVVKSAVVLLTGALRKSTRNFHASYSESLPPIWGDYQRLEQVVINLIDNACRALPSPENGILVLTSHDSDLQSVVITVTDEGVGIPPEDLHRITDPFFTTRRTEGASGLGLAVSLGIVASHGGQLDFISAPDRGTTARVILPVEKPGANQL